MLTEPLQPMGQSRGLQCKLMTYKTMLLDVCYAYTEEMLAFYLLILQHQALLMVSKDLQ